MYQLLLVYIIIAHPVGSLVGYVLFVVFCLLLLVYYLQINQQELYSLVDPNREGLRTVEEVEQGLQHIIADVISKDPQVLDCVRRL